LTFFRESHDYLSGILLMKAKRNFAAIGRQTQTSGERVQHFMTYSPWAKNAVCRQVQADILATPALQGGVLVLDESADAKSEMIQRARARGLPFEFLACDDLYGRADWFRSKLAQADILYIADVPNTTQVYLERPEWGVPPIPEDHKGRAFSTPRVLSEDEPIEVKEIAKDAETVWKALQVRSTERGKLESEYTAQRIWTLRDDVPTEEWLLIRRYSDGKHSYALSNVSAETSLEHLAWMGSQRYFVERSIQDAKSELGWDEFQAWKFLAWEHNTAMTILASWFITETQVSWAQQYPRDPQLASDLGVDELPALSYANVRTMLRAAMPLPRLSNQQARQLVAEHLLNRTRSRKSRMKRKVARSHSNSRDPT